MPLLNSFVDSIVSVGFSSELGLKVDSDSKGNASIFNSFLQPSLLAIVTADRAMYPSSRGSEFIDPCYPPIGRTSSYSNSISSNSSDLQTSNNSSGATIRTQKQHLIPAALNNLPLFCFPEGVQATYQRENERIHHVVFTQEEGKRTYALILTYQQKFVLRNVQPDEEGIYQIDDVKASIVTQRRRSVSRIPVPINSLKVDVPPTSSSSSPPTSPTTSSATRKPRSRVKPPTSLNPHGYQATQVRSNSSNDTNKQQPNYKKHTISSIQKRSV